MNIFVLSYDPRAAARMQCDAHVVKMPLETAQLLCTAFPAGEAPYRPTHERHPCALWTRRSRANYGWLLEHGRALCREYSIRYGRTHASEAVVRWCADRASGLAFPRKGRTRFALAMDERYRGGGAVASYRRYYAAAKASFCRWERGRPMPAWFRKAREDGEGFPP